MRKGICRYHAGQRTITPSLPTESVLVNGDLVNLKKSAGMKHLEIASTRLAKVRADDPSKLAFFTGRDQSQSFTSFWAQGFGTPNYAAHGGFCSVNMAAAGIYTMGGAFWEFGQPDWDHTKMFMLLV